MQPETNSAVGHTDLSNLCRVCLLPVEAENFLDLTVIYDEERNRSYNDCFAECTQMDLLAEQLEFPYLPCNLCKTCGLELQVAYDFAMRVAHVRRYLEQLQDSQCVFVEETTRIAAEQITEEDYVEYLDDEPAFDVGQEGDAEDRSDGEVISNRVIYNEDTQSPPHIDDDVIVEDVSVVSFDEESQEASINSNTAMSWQTAVVTVANESHLPLRFIERLAGRQTDVTADECDNKDTESQTDWTVGILDTVKVPGDEHTAGSPRKRYSGKFTCNYCFKVFPNHSRMLTHRRSHETNRPKHPCSQCSREYATKQALSIHMQTVHTKTAAHVCSICGKIYAIRKTLEVHMRYHTGIFPYSCELCERKFAQLSHLKTHTLVKHNSERYCCTYARCGKFFTSSTSLRNHEFTHGSMPFECEFCQHGQPSRAKLKLHVRRRHDKEMTTEQLESMRKFHVARTKLNTVKIIERGGNTTTIK